MASGRVVQLRRVNDTRALQAVTTIKEHLLCARPAGLTLLQLSTLHICARLHTGCNEVQLRVFLTSIEVGLHYERLSIWETTWSDR